MRRPATLADVGRSLGDHQRLAYSAEAPRFGSAHTSAVKKRKASSSMVTNGCQSKMVTRLSLDEEKKVPAEILAKVKEIIDVIPADFDALKQEAKSAFQI